jgi:hypothetical protein
MDQLPSKEQKKRGRKPFITGIKFILPNDIENIIVVKTLTRLHKRLAPLL